MSEDEKNSLKEYKNNYIKRQVKKKFSFYLYVIRN